MEKWKDIPGWEGYYQVSTFGRVRSIDRNVAHKRWGLAFYRGRMLRLKNIEGGYSVVGLSRPGKKPKCVSVHSLVARTFIGPCPKGKQVCHSNGYKLDNRLTNLRYDSPKNNYADAIKHGQIPKPLSGEKNPHAKLTRKQVQKIRKIGSRKTQRELGQIFNVSHNTIGSILRNESYVGVE